MVNLSVRVIRHSFTEYQMSHKLWFLPASGADAISATANTDGFTVLNAIARFYRWDNDEIRRASDEANKRKQVAILRRSQPTLFIVPRTHASDQASIKLLVGDLLMAVDAARCKQLQFTHFGFTNRVKFDWELEAFIASLLTENLAPQLRRVFIDIDYRCRDTPQFFYDKFQHQTLGTRFRDLKTLPHTEHFIRELLVPIDQV